MNRKTTHYNERTGARITVLEDTRGFLRVTLETRGAHDILESAVFTVPETGSFDVTDEVLHAYRDPSVEILLNPVHAGFERPRSRLIAGDFDVYDIALGAVRDPLHSK